MIGSLTLQLRPITSMRGGVTATTNRKLVTDVMLEKATRWRCGTFVANRPEQNINISKYQISRSVLLLSLNK